MRTFPLLLAATLPLMLGAQDAPHPRPDRRPPGQGFAAEFRPHIVERLRHTIGLSDERTQAIATRWMRWFGDSTAKGRQTQVLRMQFDEILRGPGSDDEKNAKLRPLVEQFLALRQQQLDLKRAFEDEVRAGLTPAQQVRLIYLFDEVQRMLHEGLRELEQRNGGRWRR